MTSYHSTPHPHLCSSCLQLNARFNEEVLELVRVVQGIWQRRLLDLQKQSAAAKREYRQKIQCKFKAKAHLLMENFAKERDAILSVVKFECSEILSDAKEMFLSQRRAPLSLYH